jgi:hypothetical protein
MAAIAILVLLIPVSLRLPRLSVSAFAVAAVVLVVTLDRFHRPTPAVLAVFGETAPSAERRRVAR